MPREYVKTSWVISSNFRASVSLSKKWQWHFSTVLEPSRWMGLSTSRQVSDPARCLAQPQATHHLSPYLVTLAPFWVWILYVNKGQQSISNAKCRGKRSRQFKRNLPSTLENTLCQNGFWYGIENCCWFFTLPHSAKQI